MILEGNQRGGAKNLALHLMKDENDHVDVHEVRGFVSDDLMGALNEAYAVSQGTRCRQFLYSLSLNPPPDAKVSTADFEAAIEKAERTLKLTGQPRAIVFHEKDGRRHAHAVWSRIDAEHMQAIPMSHDRRKLQEVSRDLYREHDWKMPRGFAERSERDPKNFSLADWQQAKRVGKDPKAIAQALQDAWAISDNHASFARALEERGYTLARGDKRGFVAVDLHGEVYSIPKKIGKRTKEVETRLGDRETLKSVDEAKHHIAGRMLPVLERLRTQLDQEDQTQKQALRQEQDDLVERQRHERSVLVTQQRQRQQHEAIERQARFRKGFKGLWDRLTGEHKRIRELNELQTKQAQEHAQRQKDQLIQNQLAQRRLLKAQVRTQRQKLETKKQDIERDKATYESLQRTELDNAREAFKRKRRTESERRRPRSRSPNRGPSF